VACLLVTLTLSLAGRTLGLLIGSLIQIIQASTLDSSAAAASAIRLECSRFHQVRREEHFGKQGNHTELDKLGTLWRGVDHLGGRYNSVRRSALDDSVLGRSSGESCGSMLSDFLGLDLFGHLGIQGGLLSS